MCLCFLVFEVQADGYCTKVNRLRDKKRERRVFNLDPVPAFVFVSGEV